MLQVAPATRSGCDAHQFSVHPLDSGDGSQRELTRLEVEAEILQRRHYRAQHQFPIGRIEGTRLYATQLQLAGVGIQQAFLGRDAAGRQ